MNEFKVYLIYLCPLLVLEILEYAQGKEQYVMPLLGGMKMSLSYDIANIFIRPIGGSIAVFLSIAMLFIMILGVITSPFGYMFGIPSRKYVFGGPTNPLDSPSARSLDFSFINESVYYQENKKEDEFDPQFPKFEDQALFLLPPTLQTDDCKKLAVCVAHNAIFSLPSSLHLLIRTFTNKLTDISSDYKEAIRIGALNQEDCSEVYSGCKNVECQVIIKTILYWLPPSMKNHKHRRKGGMYLKNQ